MAPNSLDTLQTVMNTQRISLDYQVQCWAHRMSKELGTRPNWITIRLRDFESGIFRIVNCDLRRFKFADISIFERFSFKVSWKFVRSVMNHFEAQKF